MKKLKSVDQIDYPNGQYYYTYEEGDDKITLKAYGRTLVLKLDGIITIPEFPCIAELINGIAYIKIEG